LYDVVGGGGLLLIFITVYVTLLGLNGSIPVREMKNNTLRNITVRFPFDLTYIKIIIIFIEMTFSYKIWFSKRISQKLKNK